MYWRNQPHGQGAQGRDGALVCKCRLGAFRLEGRSDPGRVVKGMMGCIAHVLFGDDMGSFGKHRSLIDVLGRS